LSYSHRVLAIITIGAQNSADEVAAPARFWRLRKKSSRTRKAHLRRGHILNDSAARLKSGPPQNLREAYFFSSLFSRGRRRRTQIPWRVGGRSRAGSWYPRSADGGAFV